MLLTQEHRKPFAQHFRETFSLSFPVTIAQLGDLILGIVNAVMIGQVNYLLLSAYALAYALISFPWATARGAMFVLTPKVALARGEGAVLGDESAKWKIAQLLRQSMWWGILVGVCAAAIALLEAQFLHLMGQPAEDVAMARPFLQIMSLSMVPVMIYFALKGFCEGMGNTRIPMYFMLGGVAVNLLLNWLLIYGHWGFPRLELVGSAWSFFIAKSLTALGLGLYVFRGALFRLFAKAPVSWLPDWAVQKNLLSLGFPMGLQLFFGVCSFSGIVIMMGWLPDPSQSRAAHQVAISVAGIPFLFALGIGVGGSIRVGFAKGEGDKPGMVEAGRAALGLTSIFMAVFGLAMVLGRDLFPPYFGVSQPEVLAIASQLMVIGAAYQLFDGGQTVASGLLRGCLDVRIPTILTLVAYLGIQLPLAWWMGIKLGLGVQGMWWSFVVSLAFIAVVLTWRFFKVARLVKT